MKLSLLVLLALLPLLGHAAEPEASGTPSAPTESGRTDSLVLPSRFIDALTLAPQQNYGTVAKTYGRMLENMHYTRHRFDDEISGKFFDRYLDLLDPQRIYFLETDLAEFVPLRLELDELTMRHGNTHPAYEMFNRFLQRYDQQYAFATEYLRTNRFAFATDEKFLFDRKEEARPKDLTEAQALWRDRIRSEYLAEKLTVGDRSELLDRFRTTVLVTNWNSLTGFLTNKFSPEKAEELTEFARRHYEQEKAEAGGEIQRELVADHVVAKVDQRLSSDTHDEIVKKLTRRYNRTMRNLKQFESDEVLEFWLSALGHAFDPHTDYLSKRQLEGFSINMNLSLFGIGATLQGEDGYTVIRSLVPGAPAELSKQIKVNDKIIGVAQGDGDFVDVQDEKLSKVVDQIRGPKGTKVRLLIIPAEADPSVRKTVALVRDEVKLEEAEAKAKLIEFSQNDRTNRIGVIDLPSFYAPFPVAGRPRSGSSTTRDVAKLLKKLLAEGADGIVLDLRRNGGGSLEEAINLTGLFIKSGPVVQVRNFDGKVSVDDSPDDVPVYEGPLLVLTSRLSASASEILAGALQDHDRAVIVGDNSTHGKGTVQTVQELGMLIPELANPAEAGAAKVTIRKFYRPSGASTQLKGVVPDIVLPSVENHMEVGEASLENALEWDTIKPTRYAKDGEISRLIPDLSRRSVERISADRDFEYVREDVERYRKVRAEKTVSLNEEARRTEIAENKARMEARKKEQAARQESLPTTWEITLKNVGNPGLPPAMTNQVASALSAHAAAGAGDPSAAVDGSLRNRPDESDEAADDLTSAAPVDPHLREAERILLDLVRFSSRKGVAAQNN